VAKNDLATALSRHDPVRPMERCSPAAGRCRYKRPRGSLAAAVSMEVGGVHPALAAGGHGGLEQCPSASVIAKIPLQREHDCVLRG
jgi:hypothetical protein